jgi:3-oxoacyl-[acyl-carrier protein] reductase
MNLDLSGKHALVAGSTQGIGKATAVELAQLGARVTLLARDEQKLRAVAATLPTPMQQQHDYLVADFADPAVVQKVVQQKVTDTQYHILVNNTGGPPAGTALAATPEEFLRAFNSHLICNHHLVQALVPGMKKLGYGRIINIISTSVKIPIAGLGVSNTTRGAVASWAKTLSLELAAFGITVNNVLPGSTQTGRIDEIIRNRAMRAGCSEAEIRKQMIDEIPAGRMATPEEVAAAIAFLATPAAAYINGVNLPVDGGRTGSL